MLPTSVTRVFVSAARHAAAASAIAGTGVHTKTMAAPCEQAPADTTGSKRARAAERASVPGSASWPRTGWPSRAAASAMEVPIRPVPTTPIGGRARAPPASAEVIAERPGALQVDVDDLARPPVRVEMQQDPDASRKGALHRQLPGAQQRDRAQAHAAGGLGREGRADVVGRREHDAHEVAVPEAVPLQQLGEEPLGRGQHGLPAVAVDRDRPSRRANHHRSSCTALPAHGGSGYRVTRSDRPPDLPDLLDLPDRRTSRTAPATGRPPGTVREPHPVRAPEPGRAGAGPAGRARPEGGPAA